MQFFSIFGAGFLLGGLAVNGALADDVAGTHLATSTCTESQAAAATPANGTIFQTLATTVSKSVPTLVKTSAAAVGSSTCTESEVAATTPANSTVFQTVATTVSKSSVPVSVKTSAAAAGSSTCTESEIATATSANSTIFQTVATTVSKSSVHTAVKSSVAAAGTSTCTESGIAAATPAASTTLLTVVTANSTIVHTLATTLSKPIPKPTSTTPVTTSNAPVAAASTAAPLPPVPSSCPKHVIPDTFANGDFECGGQAWRFLADSLHGTKIELPDDKGSAHDGSRFFQLTQIADVDGNGIEQGQARQTLKLVDNKIHKLSFWTQQAGPANYIVASVNGLILKAAYAKDAAEWVKTEVYFTSGPSGPSYLQFTFQVKGQGAIQRLDGVELKQVN